MEDSREIPRNAALPAKPLPVGTLVTALLVGSVLVAGVRLVSQPVVVPASPGKAASTGQDLVKATPADPRRRRSRLR